MFTGPWTRVWKLLTTVIATTALTTAPAGADTTKAVADGLYMAGAWSVTLDEGKSTYTLALQSIQNHAKEATGRLRLSYWATSPEPMRADPFRGYRLATFPELAALAPYTRHDAIAQSAYSAGLPPFGEYWFVLVLEEFDGYGCPGVWCLVDSIVAPGPQEYGLRVADLSVTQAASPAMVGTGKDVVFTLDVANNGPGPASRATLRSTLPAGTTALWTSPECMVSAGVFTCELEDLGNGASARLKLVVSAPATALTGSLTHRVEIVPADVDPVPSNNVAEAVVALTPSPNGAPVQRYRLYSPVTQEHLFTTSLAEYSALGAQSGTWIPEGPAGKVLDNPGTYGTAAAVPYYRLYDTTTRWHHWTTDPNEYYTLAEYPWWIGEGVDGYLLDTPAAGTLPLHRLMYPWVPGLHHWTTDTVERDILVASHGWVSEGVSGYVIR